MLRVAQPEVIGAGRRQFHSKIRIGVVGLQPGALVLPIVVEGQLFAGGIGQFDHGIQRRIQPARGHFGHNFFPGAALDAEYVPLSRLLDAPVDDAGQGNQLGSSLRIDSFPRKIFRQRIHGEGEMVGHICLRAHHQRINPRRILPVIAGHAGGGQVPARHLDFGLRARRTAERKDARDKRHFARRDAIDKILAPAINRIPDLEHVFAVLGHFIEENRVGMETVMVGVGDFISLRVVNGDGGLKPAGDRVGQIGHQFAGGGGDDQLLPFVRLEAVTVHAAG